MKPTMVGHMLAALILAGCGAFGGSTPPQPSITPPLGAQGVSSAPSASPPAALLSRDQVVRDASLIEMGSSHSNVRVVGALLRPWGQVSYAYGLHATHPTIITAPGMSATAYPTPVSDTWVWVVYFLEDQTVHVSATDVRHYSDAAALEVLDAATGSFLVGQSGPFDVPPSEAR